MGVNIAHYVIAGTELDIEKCGDEVEKYEVSYWEPKKALGFGVLYDGMCGEYVLAGQILAATGDKKEYFDERPISLDFDSEKIKKDLKEKLNIDCEHIKLFAVTHHT